LSGIESKHGGVSINRGTKNGQTTRDFWRELGEIVQSEANGQSIANYREDRAKVSGGATEQN
jgi:hypothetical protein